MNKPTVTPENPTKGIDSIDVAARMMDRKIETVDLDDKNKWLLFTYDIPVTEEGNKARNEFLQRAKLLGATNHTDSVYLMPWTPGAEALALDLAKVEGGKVCVWTGRTTDPAANLAVQTAYDAALTDTMADLAERLDKMEGHKIAGHQKRLLIMVDKTQEMLDGMTGAVERRGNPLHLKTLLSSYRARFAAVMR